jgi:hypothetical protein
MNRTLIFLVLFLLLGGVAAWYLTSDSDRNDSTVVGWDRQFTVENIDEVHRIFIVRRDGLETTLERNGKDWLYNGEHKANPAMMEPLLDVLENVQMKYKPPQKSVPNMVKTLATQGTKVEVYNKSGDNIKTFYIGGSAPNEEGTYMILEDAEQPYVVELPSMVGNPSVRFNHTGDDWRDKTIFDVKADNIQSISIEYPKQKNQSFRLERDGDEYEIEPFYDITPRIDLPVNEYTLDAFLDSYERVIAEGFRNDYEGKDTVLMQVPFSIITLVNKQGETTRAQFFPIQQDETIMQDPRSGEYKRVNPLFDRYFIDLNGEDFLQSQQRPIERIFWGYPSFFEGQPVPN